MNTWRSQMGDSLRQWRAFRPRLLNTPQFRHLYLLLYWPLYGLLFALVEAWSNRPFYAVEWPWLDGLIPFCEWFVIPYTAWFAYLVGMVLFTVVFDKVAFRKMMYFIMLTYTVTIIIYIIWPNKQELRPDLTALGRDNALVRFMAGYYAHDTNTNVCPSIHVLGQAAVLFASWHTPYFKGKGWQWFFAVSMVLVSLSTVFLKQHSILDVLAALVLCALAYPVAFLGDRILARVRKREQLEAKP